MQNDPLKEIEKKTQRYWYEDGIWEITFGVANLILSGFFLLVNSRSWEGPMALVLFILQMSLIIGIFSMTGRMVRWMKERITYPRTGYVAYRKPDRSMRLRRGLRAGLVAAILGAMVGLAAALENATSVLPLVIAIIMAFGLGYAGYRFALLRMYALAITTIILGFIFAMLPLTEDQLIVFYFGSFGLLMLVSGIITLLIYLRRTRAPGEPSDYSPPDQSLEQR